MMTVRYARAKVRRARMGLVRLDPYLSRKRTWTIYKRGVRAITGTGR